MIHDQFTATARPHSINDTRLFAALCAIGIEPVEGPQIFCGETQDGTPKQTWFLKPQSECGKYKTAELIAAWNDPLWHRNNPEHPFAYVKCAMNNLHAAIDHIKQSVPLYVIKGRGGKIGLLGNMNNQKHDEAILRILKR
jgi:hypothetical protein